jgi:hypothetical protein
LGSVLALTHSISISKRKKYFVIPAQAGIQWALVNRQEMDAPSGFPPARE